MNLERIKQILKKVNALIENLDDQGQTSTIERDLLLRYLRDLYENVSQPVVKKNESSVDSSIISPSLPESEKTSARVEIDNSSNDVVSKVTNPEAFSPQEVQPHVPEPNVITPVTSVIENQTTFYDAADAPPIKTESPLPDTSKVVPPEEAVINTFEKPVQYYPPAAVNEGSLETHTPVEEMTQVVETISSTPTTASKPAAPSAPDTSSSVRTPTAAPVENSVSEAATVESATSRFDSVFAEKSATDLADKFQLEKVVTIEGAMGINERMLVINELFGGDHNDFMKAVTHINQLTDFESTRKYLVEGAAVQYNWDSEDRLAMASNFVRLVRRKFG